MLSARILAVVLLLAWAGVLRTPLLDATAHPALGTLLEARSLWGAIVAVGRVLVGLLLEALRFAPLGAFAVFALPDHEGRLRRALFVFLPALAAAIGLAWLVLLARAGSAPGPFELVLPGIGVWLGGWAGLAWRRGFGARLLFLPSLLGQSLVLLLFGAGLFVLALEREPSVRERPPLGSAEKRELVERFEGKNPRRIPPGEARTLRLSGAELDRLVGWAALSTGARLRPELRLEDGGLALEASTRVPRTSRWLNLHARARVAIRNGRLSASALELRIGRLRLPSLLLDALTPFLVAGLQGDRDLRAVLPAVESLALTRDAATLAYTRVDMPPGLVARLVWGEEASASLREAVYADVDRLLAVLGATPAGDARFARALEAAFSAARARSQASGQPARENRAAILGLGIVLGHPRLARSVGERLDDERSAAALALGAGTTLRGRTDWTRHFALSGALTVLSAVAPSDAAGQLKEELDADGGSGFSFGDLLADRAGTTFAHVATRDDASAARVQQRLWGGFRVDDFFPEAADLPEGIDDAELRSRYGGTSGARYRQQMQELERRLSACAAYREGPPPAEAR